MMFEYLKYCYAVDEEDEEEADETDEAQEDNDETDAEEAEAEEADNGYVGAEEDTVIYNDIGYFFEADTPEANEKYSVVTTPDQLERQLFSQYPPKSAMESAVVMDCFDDESNERINRAWTNVRCFDINKLFDEIF